MNNCMQDTSFVCSFGICQAGISSSEMHRVLIVREGRGTISLAGRVAKVVPHAVMLLAPYDLLYVPAEEETVLDAFLFTFTPEALCAVGDVITDVFAGETYLPPARQTAAVAAFAAHMEDILCDNETIGLALSRLYLSSILLHLAAQPVPFDRTFGVACAVRYLAAHLHEDVSLDDLSSAVGISKFYLCRAFSRDSGLTPHAYLNHLRAYHAQTLLADGMSAADVALAVGFSDYSTFFRTYRKIIGRNPTTRENGI